MFAPIPQERFRKLAQAAGSGRLSATDLETYGPIKDWDTSQVTDMSRAFEE